MTSAAFSTFSSAYSPSASTTAAVGALDTRPRTAAPCSSVRPSPGPTTMALNRSSSSSTRSSQPSRGSGRPITSTGTLGADGTSRRLAREAVHAGRDVDGQYGRPTGIGRVVFAVEAGAVGGVDDQVCVGKALWRVGRLDDLHTHTAPPEAGRCVASVGP